MPEEVVYYVTNYGYLAILILVFLQEIGMPNPFPNELLLIFSGYLSFRGLLFLPFVILTALSADFIGTNILYLLFYNEGDYLIRKKPRWIPLSSGIINRLSSKVSKGGQLALFIFRLTPFTRGYTSVIAGLLNVRPKTFLPVAFISATTWTSIYVLAGYFIGPYWDLFMQHIEIFKFIMIAILVTILCLMFLIHFLKKRKEIRSNACSWNRQD
jgi:membrane protein DedA with SNARE-associated domain